MSDQFTVTTAGAAEILGISERLVKTLVARHEIPVLRLRDRVVIPVPALKQWAIEKALASVRNEDDRPHHLRPVAEEEQRGLSTRRHPRAS